MQNVKIKSSDGEEFTVTTEVAYRSEKIKQICEHQGLQKTVTISDVNGFILEKLLAWMEKYKVSSSINLGT